jgi:predicted dehydrogenase
MNKIKNILLVGYGSIGKRHLNNIKKILPDAKLIILRSEKKTKLIDGCEIVSTIKVALDYQPDAALICNPSSFHLDVALELAKAGIHLFIEKPLSNKLKEIKKFEDIVRRNKIKVMVGYNLRFTPSLIKFKSMLFDGSYGKALFISAEVGQYLPDWRPNVDYKSSVSANANLGGGALLELSHELDYLSWLFGEVEYVSGKIYKVSDLEIDVDDLVFAHIGLNHNNRRIPCSIRMDFLQHNPIRFCKVVFEKATLKWDAIKDRVIVISKDKEKIDFQGDMSINFTYENEIRHFVDSIEKDMPIPITLENGIGVLKIIEAIKVSSKTEMIVYL